MAGGELIQINDTMFKNTYSLLPESWGIIKNYNSGFASTAGYSFGHFFMNSAIVTVIGVVCTIFSFLLAAYAVSASSSSVPISGLAASS